MEAKTFICALILYNHNVNMISWNAYGVDYRRIREEVCRLKNTLNDILTWRSEDLQNMHFLYPTYEEVLSTLSESEKDFLHFDEGRKFTDLAEVAGYCYTMAKDLYECCEDLDEDCLTNIKNTLQSNYNEYKRICDNMEISHDEPEEDHDEEPGYVDFGSDEGEDDLPDIDLDFDEEEPENDSPETDDNDLTDFGFPISED